MGAVKVAIRGRLFIIKRIDLIFRNSSFIKGSATISLFVQSVDISADFYKKWRRPLLPGGQVLLAAWTFAAAYPHPYLSPRAQRDKTHVSDVFLPFDPDTTDVIRLH